MLFIILYKKFFFFFFLFSFFLMLFCFPNIIMYTLNITGTMTKTTVNKLKDFIFENHHERTGFFKESNNYSMKCLEKDLLNTCSHINTKRVDYYLNWDAMHNLKKVELELIPDSEKRLLFQKCMSSKLS